MTERLLKVLPLGVFGSLIAILTAGFTPAQEPIPLLPPGQPAPIPLPLPGQPGFPAQPEQPAQGDGIEVLAKGPVHEAFAATAEGPTASPVVAKQPPDPIEELPPDQKPEGDNVQWLPGYWSWDEENTRFIWISGFWRQPPPGRVWVPGSWREARGGFQWVSGFWQPVVAQQPQQVQQQPEVEYLPEPPVTIEVGPTVPAPNATSFYIPGSWVWRNKYVWRPGVWVGYRSNWVWAPARFQWTPAGYVFIDGYWDYPLATRGVLFAPIAFSRPVYVQPAFIYTPVYVVSEPCMVGALFVRRGHGNYYFGDYYEPQYATAGYSAWCGTYTRTGFSIGFGVGRSWGYDPLWSYYSVAYRDTPTWNRGVGDLYHGRYRGDIARPPVTLVQQNTTINNITKTNVTNVTNNITVVNGSATVSGKDVSNVAMVAPLKVAPDLQRTKFQAVSAENRRSEAVAAKQLTEVAVQRNKLETAVVNQPRPVVQPPQPGQPAVAVQPKSIKLDVPKAAVARAQVTDEKKAPPPNPHQAAVGGKPKVDLPKVDPKSPIVFPKTDPPKVDPKLPVNPKVDPKLPVNPKVDPKPPVNPPLTPMPKVDLPKVDPKPPVNPPLTPMPKVELPKVDPKPPVVLPPGNPPKLPVNPPFTPAPKVDLPRPPVNLPPTPKADPPRPPVNPPLPPAPKVELPKFDPKLPPGLPPANPLPKFDPKLPPVGNPPPKLNPPAPKVDPKAPPPPPPPPPPPLAPPKPPVAFAPPVQPRPAALVPAAQPPKVVQPPKAQPAVQPKAQPAPLGKPAPKERGNRE